MTGMSLFSPLVSATDLAGQLGDPGLVIVDVRHDLTQVEGWGEAQYRSGHIPGAVFAHLDRDLSAPKTGRNGRHPLPTPEAAAAVFGRFGIDADQVVVAYDQGSGAFAARLWWMLRWLGHEHVAVLDGGFAAWNAGGRPVATTTPTPPVRTFVPQVKPLTVAADELLGQLDDPAVVILDARAPERFRGEVEPLDPVAGHIPNARNRPYTLNLGSDGCFKSSSALQSEFAALLVDRPAAVVVNQCGSGVTACHNVLAMELAGLTGSLLYPGSWSEWCADPARPVARGA